MLSVAPYELRFNLFLLAFSAHYTLTGILGHRISLLTFVCLTRPTHGSDRDCNVWHILHINLVVKKTIVYCETVNQFYKLFVDIS